MNQTNRPTPTPTKHAIEQARAKGFTAEQTWKVVTDPDVTYPSGSKYPGQERRIRDGIVAVVHIADNKIITFYENVKETALRPDQIAKGEKIGAK